MILKGGIIEKPSTLEDEYFYEEIMKKTFIFNFKERIEFEQLKPLIEEYKNKIKQKLNIVESPYSII